MSGLIDYAQRRARRDPEFADGLEKGYQAFKIGVLLRRAREGSELTQKRLKPEELDELLRGDGGDMDRD